MQVIERLTVKVLIVPNFSRADALEGARHLEDWLGDQGIDVVWARDKKLFPHAEDSAEGCARGLARR